MKKKPPRRVLLKLSGEALADEQGVGVNHSRLMALAEDVAIAAKNDVEIGIVVGGGNYIRGSQSSEAFLERTTADHMGMLATVMNALVLRDALEANGQHTLVLSAFSVAGIADGFNVRTAIEALSSKKVVIFAGGTGNPFVTTDSAASLRAIEINADVLLKATKVDGIYDADPKRNKNAKRFSALTFSEALDKRLAVMDVAAFSQCRDYNIPIRVFNLFQKGALYDALMGEAIGTLVASSKE